MTVPSKPAAPAVPLRTQPSTREARVEPWLSFQDGDLSAYLRAWLDNADEQATAAIAAVAAQSLSALDLADHADDWLFVNEAGDGLAMRAATEVQIATQAEAKAGTNNTKIMSPLRTKQAADATAAASPWARIVTKTANNSASLEFTEFDSTKYVDYEFRFRNLLPAVDRSYLRIRNSDDGGVTTTVVNVAGYWSLNPWSFEVSDIGRGGADEPGTSGALIVFNLHENSGGAARFHAVYAHYTGGTRYIQRAGLLRRPSSDGPLNYVGFFTSYVPSETHVDTTFTSGSITLYGRRI